MSYVQGIKEARISAGMTQEQLAKAVGVAKSTITSYEKGNREISAGMIQKIAQATGSSVEFIFQDEENEKQPAENDGLSQRELALIQSMQGLSPNERELALDLCSALVLELLRHHKVAAETQAAVPAGLSR